MGFKSIPDMHNTLLVQAFGFNNACIYFDTVPSKYVAPFMWTVNFALFSM